MSLRLPVGEVTVLLGPGVARRRMMNRLDDATGRCADGHDAGVRRLGARTADPLAERLAALDRIGPVAILLVDRFTDGLTATQRRVLLARLPALAARGTAVLVDDVDPVAGIAVAHGALRVDRDGDVRVERLAYLAS